MKRVLVALVAALGIAACTSERHAEPTSRLPGGDLPVLWPMPDYTAVDQHGQAVTQAALVGSVWIADLIFTTCSSVCPMITSRMVLLQRAISHPGVRFLSISVDPGHDTPEALKRYAETWAPGEGRWTLLRMEPPVLAQTVAGMKMVAERTPDPENPVAHSSYFTLIDAQGRIRRIYDSGDPAALKELEADARALAGPVEAPEAPATVEQTGAALYASLGCDGCHAKAWIAPNLVGVGGRTVIFDSLTSIKADDAYLRESILDPSARVVPGFLDLMPSYREQISDTQLESLVAYMRSLTGPGEGAPETAAGELAGTSRDPVCDMAVVTSPAAPHTTYGGHDWYFCSERCRDAFVASPARYASSGAGAR